MLVNFQPKWIYWKINAWYVKFIPCVQYALLERIFCREALVECVIELNHFISQSWDSTWLWYLLPFQAYWKNTEPVIHIARRKEKQKPNKQTPKNHPQNHSCEAIRDSCYQICFVLSLQWTAIWGSVSINVNYLISM